MAKQSRGANTVSASAQGLTADRLASINLLIIQVAQLVREIALG